MSNDHAIGLSDAQVAAFIEDGYVRLDGAFSAVLAAECRTALWQATGLSPDSPATWTAPVIRIGSMASPPFVAAANTPRLHKAYDQLTGKGRWVAPRGIGTFPIRFPSPQSAGDDGWHVDMSFGLEDPDFLEWRVNVKSTGRLLLMLFLFSDVGERDAPTIIRAGSHAVIARQLLPHGEAGLSLRELAADGFRSSADCPEILATGPASTAYLCHPFLVHRAQPHRGTTPRFMAQPPLLAVGEFDPTLPSSPVQIAIRQACGLVL